LASRARGGREPASVTRLPLSIAAEMRAAGFCAAAYVEQERRRARPQTEAANCFNTGVFIGFVMGIGTLV
jgi:hypothetical protein